MPEGLGRKAAVAQKQIGVITLEGLIMSGSSGIFSAAGTGDILRQLHDAAEDPDIAALVLRINSPGGTVAASQELYREALRVKEAGKKLVVSMGDVAASGGYMVSCAADKIVANPGTTTGSIGVIMEFQNVEGLYDKLGLKENVIKSAPHKDIGSPTRPMTDEERAIFQDMINEMYGQFVDIVARGRHMSVEQVKKLADGRVYTGTRAKELGLVDEIGDYYDAIKIAADLAGIEGKPVIKEYGRKTALEALLSGVKSAAVTLLGRTFGISPGANPDGAMLPGDGNFSGRKFLLDFLPEKVGLSVIYP
ncbi:MAG TPA: signal peptide peptidase SppA [Thermoanaerobacterales bacterium]|nr:signal peptide peptidase SppA [Thermoanaerobacterales bacterium]